LTPTVPVVLGNLLTGRGQYGAAEQAYQAALQIDPRSVGALLGLGHLHEVQKQVGPAREAYGAALKVGPSDPGVWHSWGAFLATQNDWSGAEAAYDKAIALAPNEAAGYLGRGQVAEIRRTSVEAVRQARLAAGVQVGAGAA